LTDPSGHLWRDKWTALIGPLSCSECSGFRVPRTKIQEAVGGLSPSLEWRKDPGFRVQGSGFRVQGSGSVVLGAGLDRGGVAAKRRFKDARELAVAVWDVLIPYQGSGFRRPIDH